MTEVLRLGERLKDLPSLPQAVLELQSALSRDDVSLDELAAAVSRDQALAAKALRIANCSFYGVPTRVTSIQQAISVLGLRSVSTMLTAAAVSDIFPRIACEGFDLGRYWRHSIAVALCAREVARSLRLDPDTAFTGGLLHDLGRLVLAAQAPQALAATYALRARQDGPMLDAERASLGTDHMRLGADVATRWHFGKPVADAIALHHEPPPAAAPTVVDVVHVADNIVHALDLACDPDELVPALDLTVWTRVALGPDRCFALFERTETELEALCEALAV